LGIKIAYEIAVLGKEVESMLRLETCGRYRYFAPAHRIYRTVNSSDFCTLSEPENENSNGKHSHNGNQEH